MQLALVGHVTDSNMTIVFIRNIHILTVQSIFFLTVTKFKFKCTIKVWTQGLIYSGTKQAMFLLLWLHLEQFENARCKQEYCAVNVLFIQHEVNIEATVY